MLKLNISQQPAKLELNITDPVLNIKTTSPKMNLTTDPFVVEIHRIEGKLEIDHYPCRYSIGFRNNSDFSADAAQLGKQNALDYIGKVAAEGDRIASIESGESAIANIATESNFSDAPDITWARTELPKITYHQGKVEFNPSRGKVNMNFERGTVDLDLQRGQVHGNMTKYQSIRFWTSEGQYDISV